MLYKWAPGTQIKPTSERFDNFMARYTDASARQLEKRNLQRSKANEKFDNQLVKLTKQNEIMRKRRERRLTKADEKESLRRHDQTKGLRQETIVDPDESDESYHTKISEEKINSQSEYSAENDVEQEDK